MVAEKYAPFFKLIQTYDNKVNIVVYRYRNNTNLKDTEMELKVTEYE